MSYIGKGSHFANLGSKFFDGDGTAMSISLDYPAPNSASVLVFIDGIKQDTSAYSLVGSTLTFTGTVASGTNNIEVVQLGILINQNEISDQTVRLSSLVTTGTASGGAFLDGTMEWKDISPFGGVVGENVFFNNEKEINSSYSVEASTNAMSAGPINVASGVTVTIPSGSNWTIV